MALGGGSFTERNKVLPGAYINFVSAARAAAILSERGYVAMPLEMDWGPDGEVFTLNGSDLLERSLELFGYAYHHDKLKGIRDLFKNARTLYGCRVNGGGIRAACDYATARHAGVRGNDLRLVISQTGEHYTVKTLLDEAEMDIQEVSEAADLVDNAYVTFKGETALQVTAGVPLTGGTSGKPSEADYQKFLDQIQSYSFHAMGLVSDDEAVKKQFADFTKSMRDEMGIKFQTVLFRYAADYEGIVSLENCLAGSAAAEDSGAPLSTDACSLVYWVTGAIAGCAVNASNTNKTYDGEFKVDTAYTQKALEEAIKGGRFILHRVGDETRVLEDINTLVTYTEEKGKDFSSNQTMRVLDQIGNDVAALFGNKYLGKIPNDEAGRVSLWNDVVTYYRELEKIRAIENFKADDIVIAKGEGKKSIVASCPVTPISAMAQLYMTVVVQ